jgi:hypothetical protein
VAVGSAAAAAVLTAVLVVALLQVLQPILLRPDAKGVRAALAWLAWAGTLALHSMAPATLDSADKLLRWLLLWHALSCTAALAGLSNRAAALAGRLCAAGLRLQAAMVWGSVVVHRLAFSPLWREGSAACWAWAGASASGITAKLGGAPPAQVAALDAFACRSLTWGWLLLEAAAAVLALGSILRPASLSAAAAATALLAHLLYAVVLGDVAWAALGIALAAGLASAAQAGGAGSGQGPPPPVCAGARCSPRWSRALPAAVVGLHAVAWLGFLVSDAQLLPSTVLPSLVTDLKLHQGWPRTVQVGERVPVHRWALHVLVKDGNQSFTDASVARYDLFQLWQARTLADLVSAGLLCGGRGQFAPPRLPVFPGRRLTHALPASPAPGPCTEPQWGPGALAGRPFLAQSYSRAFALGFCGQGCPRQAAQTCTLPSAAA